MESAGDISSAAALSESKMFGSATGAAARARASAAARSAGTDELARFATNSL